MVDQVALGPVPTAILTGAETGGAGTALAMAAMKMTVGAPAVLRTGAGEGAAAALLTPMALTGAGPGRAALGGHFTLFMSRLPFSAAPN